MVSRHFRHKYQGLGLFILILLLPFVAISSSEKATNEKQVVVSMRMIGHEVLLCLGDSESRVMPIEKIDGYFKIPFEFEFGFDPDDIINIVNSVMRETGAATDYLVEVEQCESKDVVHSFLTKKGTSPDVIACQGRLLPKDCYNILVTLLDVENSIGAPAKADPSNPHNSAYLIVPFLFLIGLTGYYISKKDSASRNPDVILLGSSEYDKRNMTISIGNKSVGLSNKESELLTLLHASANEPVEREAILRKVWGDEGDYIGRTLDVFISKLRKKLEPDPAVRIVNIRGVGYKLVMI